MSGDVTYGDRETMMNGPVLDSERHKPAAEQHTANMIGHSLGIAMKGSQPCCDLRHDTTRQSGVDVTESVSDVLRDVQPVAP